MNTNGENAQDMLSRLFNLQHDMQTSMGFDYPWMSDDQRIDYVRWNILALTDELHEALAETKWKPWAPARRYDQAVDNDKFGGELVDAMHFLINLFLVVGWDADQVFERYIAKHNVNKRRQATQVFTKCANRGCRRALDEPGAALPFTRHDGNTHHEDLAWCNEGCYDAWEQARAGEMLESGGASS